MSLKHLEKNFAFVQKIKIMNQEIRIKGPEDLEAVQLLNYFHFMRPQDEEEVSSFDDTVVKSHKKAPTCLAESSAPPLLSCKGLLDPQLKPSAFHL